MVERIFAQRLRELREEKNLTQQILSSKIGLTQRKVSKLETLQLIPSPQIIVDIANYFGVTTDYLLGLEN